MITLNEIRQCLQGRGQPPRRCWVAAAPPGGGSSPDAAIGVSEPTLRSLSPETRQVFKDAQENIVQLNKSRLRALEELRNAKHTIAELESKLEEAVGEAVQASRQVAELQARTSLQQAAASPASVASFDDLSGFKAAVPTVAAAAATASAVIDEAPGPTPAPSVTVVYSTGWTSACLHYNADGNGWTAAPGARMQEGSGRFPGTKVFTVQNANYLEFVLNDGQSDWDHPSPYGEDSGQKNYVASSPGIWRLKNGKLSKLE